MTTFKRTLAGAGWAPVSRRMMDDQRLSLAARGALGWLVTRPDEWEINLEYALKNWGISRPTWQKIRKELEAAGYLHQLKTKENGRFKWEYHLTDDPTINKISIDKNFSDRNSAARKIDDIKKQVFKETDSKKTGKERESRASARPAPSLSPSGGDAKAKPQQHTSQEGILLINAEDEAQLARLIQTHGVEKVTAAAEEVQEKGERVYVSAVLKLLSQKVTSRKNVNRTWRHGKTTEQPVTRHETRF